MTVPAIGEVNVAPARAAWASASCARATVTLAWSAAIWEAEAAALWSVESLARPAATLALAEATWLVNDADEMVASCWPAWTF